MLSPTRRHAAPRRIDQGAVAAVAYVCLAIALAAAGDQPGGILVIVALVVTGVVGGCLIAQHWAPALALVWLVIGVVARDDETSVVGGMILAVAPAVVAAASLQAGVLIANRLSRHGVGDD